MNHRIPTMIIGAGDACYELIYDLKSKSIEKYDIKCIIDDDQNKIGKEVLGIPVIGDRSTIEEYVKRFEIRLIIFSIPSASSEDRRDILEKCNRTGCTIKMLPSYSQLINPDINYHMVRDIEIEDLLGRNVNINQSDEIGKYLRGKTVLVTGGAGSIGSELCRQVLLQNPERLIVVDISENSIFDLMHELKQRYPENSIDALIGSVRDVQRMREIFERYHPQVVFHAAAHKHVPLMEGSPKEAIKNNIFGTKNVVDLSDEYLCERFVLISTDKAVRPANVMGATKRICELIIQSKSCRSKTIYTAVRFGNVLGSNGSVVPLFRKQIHAGGPVTVTDENVTRFFMTIPEAVSLVLEAGALAKGSEIFVLDMGEPVKIIDMARKMIILSGLKPDRDIDIKVVGLRPGEKLYEELMLDQENLEKTENGRIFVMKPQKVEENWIEVELETLKGEIGSAGNEYMKIIRRLVPEYTGEYQ